METREEKETFIQECWDKFKEPRDTVSMPNLPTLTDKQIDSMVMWYQYLLQEEEQLLECSREIYSIHLKSTSGESQDISLINEIRKSIFEEYRKVSKYMSQADEVIQLDSITSLQNKLFNAFVRELSNGNINQCFLGFWDYMDQVFRKKDTVNKTEIMQIFSMTEGFISLSEKKS